MQDLNKHIQSNNDKQEVANEPLETISGEADDIIKEQSVDDQNKIQVDNPGVNENYQAPGSADNEKNDPESTTSKVNTKSATELPNSETSPKFSKVSRPQISRNLNYTKHINKHGTEDMTKSEIRAHFQESDHLLCLTCGSKMNKTSKLSALVKHLQSKKHNTFKSNDEPQSKQPKNNNKPFTCNVCSKMFRSKDNMQLHMKVHGGNVESCRQLKSVDWALLNRRHLKPPKTSTAKP